MLGDGTTFVNFGQKPIRGNARCLYEPHEKKCKLTDQEGSRIGDSENLFNISSIKLFPFSVHSNDRQIHWPNIPLFAQLKRIFLLSLQEIILIHFIFPVLRLSRMFGFAFSAAFVAANLLEVITARMEMLN